MQDTDAQLVSRTLGGDRSAFDKLVDRYRVRAFRLALSRARSREEAVDIAQEAFVRAYMSLGTLKDPERFAPWLMAIVRNLCKMRLRRRTEVALLPDLADTAHAADPHADRDRAKEALERLPEGTRAAATLFFIEEMRQSEIAERLGVSLPAVKARIREARARLRKEMADMMPKSRNEDALGESFTGSLRHKLELARWFGVIADHLASGGDVMTGLRAVCKDDYSAHLLDATKKMIDSIQAGRTVRDALAEIPALASPEAVAMVRAGEAFGSLHIAIRCLADWLDVQGAQRDIELVFWCRTFGYLLAAGVPLRETIDHGLGIARSKALQQATREMGQTLEKLGDRQPTHSPLRPILDRYPDVFPPILRAAILAGEYAGVLDLALFWTADEMAGDLARKIARPLVPSPREPGPKQVAVAGIAEKLPGPCMKLISDPAPDIRAAVIDILGRLAYKDAAPEIAERMEDESAEVRRMAAQVVADMGYRDAAGALVQRITDDDPVVRKTAIESITLLDLHSAAQAVAEAIRDTDHRVIMAAIESLQALHEEEVMKRKAIELFNSDSWENQKRAAYLLRYFLPPEVVQGLIDRLAAKPELSPREMNAVIAAGLYGCIEARPILNKMVGDPRVSRMAARALQESGDAASAAAIRAAIETGGLGPEMRRVAEEIEAR